MKVYYNTEENFVQINWKFRYIVKNNISRLWVSSISKNKRTVFHMRLRTQCSSLSWDLFRKNMTDSPLCRCGGLENASHYFLQCPLYNTHRVSLLRTISQYSQPSIEVILNGNSVLPNDTNTCIFKAVHKFIEKNEAL